MIIAVPPWLSPYSVSARIIADDRLVRLLTGAPGGISPHSEISFPPACLQGPRSQLRIRSQRNLFSDQAILRRTPFHQCVVRFAF
ncbi:hypothetical protein D3C73_576620 [compost metagenome]